MARMPANRRAALRHGAAALALASLLGGCNSVPDAVNPASWWHHLEGGEIARQRPPPPGADQPYPNLATVPPKPAAIDQKALEKITQGLVADQSVAAANAAAAPLADPSSPSASPQLFGAGNGAVAPPAPGSTMVPPPTPRPQPVGGLSASLP
ncbi:MAG: hypothetical protein KGL12_15440, partial [Rhodospirillales bacterium]|nr:hypothetical protein [Rhodospirillales bacterium]